MDTLCAMLNISGNRCLVQGLGPVQAENVNKAGAGKSAKFAEVYEQLQTILPEADTARKEGRSLDEKAVLINLLDGRTEVGEEKKNGLGCEAGLTGMISARPLIQFGNADDITKKKTDPATVAASHHAQSSISETLVSAGRADVITTRQQRAALPAGIIPDGSAASLTGQANDPGHAGKIMTATGLQGDKITTLASFIAEQKDSAGPIRQAAQGNRSEITPAPAAQKGVVSFNAAPLKPVADQDFRPIGRPGRTVNPASVSVADRATTNNGATQPIAESAVNVKQKVGQAGQVEAGLRLAIEKTTDKASETGKFFSEFNQPSGLQNIQVNLQPPGAVKPVMTKSSLEQITNYMAEQMNQGSSRLEIDLQPEALGRIKLMFQIEDGSLTVRIIAHTEEAHHLLDANLQSMKDNLHQQGIKITDLNLDLANQERQGNQTGHEYQETGRPVKKLADRKESYVSIGMGEPNPVQYSRLNILA